MSKDFLTRNKSLPDEISINPIFARGGEESVPRFKLREKGMLPETAYQIVHDEIGLDGNARLNLATFVTTWMEPEADKLYMETVDKNMIDKDEYPQTAAIEERCIHILADLWNSPHPHNTIGTSTTGSSEACMLGGLAMKRRWQKNRKAQGKPIDKPNIVFSTAVQVVWEKFANYWDVEPRFVDITPEKPYLSPEGVLKVVDENTIGVVPILGNTYTGLNDPVADIAKALDEFQEKTGLDIPIHVDAASGGFIAPFLNEDLIWDFRLPRVHSINASGHKYGLVYPGLGWVVWRDSSVLPEDLIFRVSYLGGDMPTFTLNFSRPGAQVLLQYYNFLRLGREGYYKVQKASRDVAHYLSKEIEKMGMFTLFSDGTDIPVLSWRLKEDYTDKWNLYNLSEKLRERGWQIPAYPLPKSMEDVIIMRIVVRNGLSIDLAHLLIDDIKRSVEYLNNLEGKMPKEKPNIHFHH
ncbi:MAG: glutamate decarboxylase [Minisyncoccia bacterium]